MVKKLTILNIREMSKYYSKKFRYKSTCLHNNGCNLSVLCGISHKNVVCLVTILKKW